MAYGFLFRLYLKTMSSTPHQPRRLVHSDSNSSIEPENNIEFQAADALASSHGDAYRGAGVLIGLLGILVVFIAVTPAGLSIENESTLVMLGVAKVVLMVAILVNVYLYGNRSKHHSEWITYRRKAESLRYAGLKELKEKLNSNLESGDAAAVSEHLFAELRRTLEGENGQIAYNQRKSRQYKSIEHFSSRLSWYGFLFVLICAVWLLLSELHLAPHTSLLIYGTAAVPAFVGGIHGINGLLKVESLLEEHQNMALVLQGLCGELNLANPRDSVTMLEICGRVYDHLVARDVLWAESVEKIKIKPA